MVWWRSFSLPAKILVESFNFMSWIKKVSTFIRHRSCVVPPSPYFCRRFVATVLHGFSSSCNWFASFRTGCSSQLPRDNRPLKPRKKETWAVCLSRLGGYLLGGLFSHECQPREIFSLPWNNLPTCLDNIFSFYEILLKLKNARKSSEKSYSEKLFVLKLYRVMQ